jgi:hypothetical protein
MTAEEVHRIALASLEASTFDYAPSWVVDRGAYLLDARGSLGKALVVPSRGCVVVPDFEAQRFSIPSGPEQVWIVAPTKTGYIFFDDRSASFGQAMGPALDDGSYQSIGHRSSDILEMWLA